jgi:uncharacterized membrane protein
VRHRTSAFLVGCVFSSLLCVALAQTEPKAPPQPEKGVLDVVVLDEAGKPLPGVLVSVPGFRSTTGLAGTCRFGLLPGRYAVLIRKSGYRGRRVNAGVRPAETTTTHVTLQKLPSRSPQK